MIRKIFDFIESHTMIVVVVAAIVLMVGMNAVTAALAPKPQAAPTQQEQGTGSGEDGGGEAQGGGEAAGKAAAKPTKGQEEVISGYGDDAKQVVTALNSVDWVEGAGNGSIKFDGDAYTVFGADVSGKGETGVLAIEDSMNIGTISLDEPVPGTSRADSRILMVLDAKGKSRLMQLITLVGQDGSNKGYILNSSLFGQGSYRSRERDARVEVGAVDEQALGILGTDQGKIAKAVEEYAAKVSPLATKATWVGTVTKDYKSGSGWVSFTLDDSGTTIVRVTVGKDGVKAESDQ